MLCSYSLGGVPVVGVELDVFNDPAKLVGKLEFHTDIAVFVDLDMVYQLHKDLPAPDVNDPRRLPVLPAPQTGFPVRR